MSKWTIADIKRKGLDCNLDDVKPKNNNALPKNNMVNGKISIEKETISKVLWVFKHEGKIDNYETELQFHPERKFRFDWAIPSMKLAVEYEGIFSKKSRHTNVNGFTTDCEKYNLAQIDGWKVLRYTAKNYEQFASDLRKIINQMANLQKC